MDGDDHGIAAHLLLIEGGWTDVAAVAPRPEP